jgi:hypothetical protein
LLSQHIVTIYVKKKQFNQEVILEIGEVSNGK